MGSRQARRAANKEGNLYTVKTGFNTIFTDQQLSATVLQAVQLVSPILIASNVLANLHVLRCLETDGHVSKLDQTFFSNCMYAVSHATGRRAVQFNRAKNVSLTESLDMIRLAGWLKHCNLSLSLSLSYTSSSSLNISKLQKDQPTLKM